ncbi:MAG: hypothetical protein QM711_06105 [Micropruina sp.]|uniref:hypothetical protein n=1 Tax=Micropruina sp. TaxID=2737536 RepID=UPI0039E637DC
MAFKIQLLSDVAGFLRGTSSVEDALDDVADSLDDLARDTKQNADKAADSLEREFSDALDQVQRETKKTGRKLGDDLKDGTREAGEGFDDLKDEANERAREAAASFSGEFDDVADYVQEVLAQALAGFGPVGAAAGLAAAAGIGILVAGLQDSAEKAEEAKQRVLDLADALGEVKGDPAALRWADLLKGKLNEIVDTKEWYEFWQDKPKTQMEEWSKSAQKFGISMQDVIRAQTGDAESLARINATLDQQYRDLIDKYYASAAGTGEMNDQYRQQADEVKRVQESMNSGNKELQDAKRYSEELASSLQGLSDPMGRAADASATFTDSLNDHLSVADEGLDRFVRKGKLSLDAWSAELAKRAREAEAVQDFSVNIAPKLSPEAMARFAELPIETQQQIARAFRDGGKADRKKIVQNLEAEAKVTKVQINTSEAQKQASAKPVEIPTTVAQAGAVKGAQEAADNAQKVANKDSNKIEFRTKVNDDGLQSAVNRVAASIHEPTIYVRVKTKKDAE